jgi:hypothetical protein
MQIQENRVIIYEKPSASPVVVDMFANINNYKKKQGST